MVNRSIDDLLNEVRLLNNHIYHAAEALHADEPITVGMRAVLEFLLKNGPTTVPDMARERSVTRQHIQMLVNRLLDDEWVTLDTNPQHKRSSLVALTRDGEKLIRRMRQREARLFEKTTYGASARQIETATETLRDIRRALTIKET